MDWTFRLMGTTKAKIVEPYKSFYEARNRARRMAAEDKSIEFVAFFADEYPEVHTVIQGG